MLVHAAFGGSTNLVLHLPAIAHAAGLADADGGRLAAGRTAPRRGSWTRSPTGRATIPRCTSSWPAGCPEVLLHLRRMGLLHRDVLTATGETLDETLDWWEASERRRRMKERLREADGVDADEVMMDADAARRRGPRRAPPSSRWATWRREGRS